MKYILYSKVWLEGGCSGNLVLFVNLQRSNTNWQSSKVQNLQDLWLNTILNSSTLNLPMTQYHPFT